MTDETKPKSHAKVVTQLVLITVGMVAFVFIGLVPMYYWICEITGIGGRTTSATSAAYVMEVDESRSLRVNFLASNQADMPWEFRAMTSTVNVHPGEQATVMFYIKNTTRQTMTAQAVPSLSPFYVTEYFHKIECFCFEQQTLEPGESMEMPMHFFVDNRVPEQITSIALSYSLFNLPDVAKSRVKEKL
ncbi:cytochrome c oxidase assembly protein [Salinispirillum sp. LH 10-3-1]|uniref:Cytochrome c oxidase assembly protein CtaG n=1 Tax=Salinispirillum sp. LH 10-3-1 TaxID=2952525 RepID=A0AB38YFP2_9GAMM